MIALALVSAESAPPATLKLMTIGASLSRGEHLQELQRLLVENGVTWFEFVGPVSEKGTPRPTNRQSYGGMKFGDMLNGRMSKGQWQTGARESVPQYQPDVFLLLGGTNNVIRADISGLDDAKKEWSELVDYLICERPRAVFYISTVPPVHPEGKWAKQQPGFDAFNQWLREEITRRAESGQRLFVVETGREIAREDYRDDGLHLLESGQKKIGRAWFDALQKDGFLKFQGEPPNQDTSTSRSP